MKLSGLDLAAFIILIIGGLNWGLIGLLNFNLVAFLFGAIPLIARLIYIIVGVAAGYAIYYFFFNKTRTGPI